MSLYAQKTIQKLFQIVGRADNLGHVSGDAGPVLRVLMDNDICLIDTKSTDYNGRICLVYSPQAKKFLYQRLFIDGETVLVCDPTDGEENETIPLDELRVDGIVIGIVRSLGVEARVDLENGMNLGKDSQMIRSKIITSRIWTMPLLQKSIGAAMGIAAL